MKKLLKESLSAVGLEMRRMPDRELPKIRDISIDGIDRSFWIVNPFTKSWWDHETLDLDAELSELKRITSPSDRVMEVGSHHGMVTLMLSQWVGSDGEVLAIEAEAGNAMALYANCFSNKTSNVRAHHIAIGQTRGVVRFGGESLAAASGTVREVEMVTADQFLIENDGQAIDVLKIDVEGYEADVLKGAEHLLAQKPKLALELHVDLLKPAGSSAREVWNLLDRRGMFDGRTLTAVCRPDRTNVFTVGRFEDLPESGVINLFAA